MDNRKSTPARFARPLLAMGLALLLAGIVLTVAPAQSRDIDEAGPEPAVEQTATTVSQSLAGMDELRAGDLVAARSAIETHLTQEPNDVEARYVLAVTYEREGRYTAAIDAYERILRDEPTHFEAVFRIGSLHELQGDVDLAAESYERALDINSDFAAAQLALAEIRMAEGDAETAADLYYDLIEVRPMGVHLDGVRVKLAEALAELGQWDNARLQLERALSDNPDNQEGRRLLTAFEDERAREEASEGED